MEDMPTIRQVGLPPNDRTDELRVRCSTIALKDIKLMNAGLAIACIATLTSLPVAAQDEEVHHRFAQANGLKVHYVESGSGPLVVLVHGFPESWYSWRHQLPALAKAGFHVVALDMRGYGQTDVPPEIASYTIMHLVGDVTGLVEALGEKHAIIVGHDWGASVAWSAALLRPEMFQAVVAMSVPYRPRGPVAPLRALRDAGLYTYYWLYYQEPGVAEAEYDRDPRVTLRRLMFSLSGDAPSDRPDPSILKPGKGRLESTIDPERLPSWLKEADLDYMTADLKRTGFRGGVNWYRNIDRNWELLAPWSGVPIQQPALFIAGAKDPVITYATNKEPLVALKTTVPNLKRQLIIEGAGHWIQQERPKEVNAALIEFLRNISAH
jgi:pimeloyl-ACP methyl ester carboxylesterase